MPVDLLGRGEARIGAQEKAPGDEGGDVVPGYMVDGVGECYFVSVRGEGTQAEGLGYGSCEGDEEAGWGTREGVFHGGGVMEGLAGKMVMMGLEANMKAI
jgi:hypothetical protein